MYDRYFLFSYYAMGHSKEWHGNLCMVSKVFPNNKDVKAEITKAIEVQGDKPKAMAIMNVFEFKSKADFMSFSVGQ